MLSGCQPVSLSACQAVSLSACQSVSLSVCQSIEQFGSHSTDFHITSNKKNIRKSVEQIQVSLKSDTNNGYFTRRRIYIYDISLNSSYNNKCFRRNLYMKSVYRVGHKSLTTLCKSQSMRNRWITTICDLIRPREKSLGGVILTAASL